ncbi:L-2-hydroxyglutarate oxidase [Leifsonia sp. H3M29-4]|uniref:L-2-hydroxyglutarate oxidase n=1 Tax=Salinibacterium metalliresistens TaxID=3031321 RepID=UPI0023DA9328|nr:L-2-hydroxyglutarate oxidase [Salinibacterium metalliresistens]MDF1479164.1 L-2-hydroxyglutarate oxidase [Salinibacterium metalliresistens]
MSPKSVTIIGGGIIGLALAQRLTSQGLAVTVLEKESRWAAHQTGHNSGVIHAGPYYKPGSLKATMCLAGNRSMTAFAQEHGIAYETCGKLIVATSEAEVPRLEALAARASANGVTCRLISMEEAHEYEPHVGGVRALRVENTGIIDYKAVSAKFAELAAEGGANLILGTRARAIRSSDRDVVVEHDLGEVTSDLLINAAGLQSDKVARLAGMTPTVQIVPFRGEYYELSTASEHLVNGLIYPVPDPDMPFLGVHLTRMIDGTVHAGPNAVLALSREGYKWSTVSPGDLFRTLTFPGFLKLASGNIGTGAQEILRSFSKRRFARDLARLVPEITPADLVPSGAGVRAQAIGRDGKLVDDFVIQQDRNQIHVLNAPSPAATSSLEIARHIASLVA